jgi:pyruvate/2-oxoacid:ferredoxin oxidoreductase alpha subunit
MEERISKEIKLSAAKDLVASYLRGEGGKNVTPEQIGEVFKQVYNAIDQTFPDGEKRRIGLGID